jgi:hypothetical protein
VLRGRLDRGRERLRARLARRGLTLSVGLLPAALAPGLAEGGTPAALVDSTLKAALLVAAGKVVPALSGQVAALTQGVLQTMWWSKAKIVVACVLALGALGIGAVLARQDGSAGPPAGRVASGPPARPARPKKSDAPPSGGRAPAKAPAPRADKKRYAFAMRDQPWIKVFEWYAEHTGLAYVGAFKPAGTFTFIPPRGKRKYTTEEITDTINEALLARKYVLVRRAASFTVLPADERVDPLLVPRLKLADLEKRARTELVSVVLPLKSVRAREIGADVKKMLGPFGEVVILETGNRLILQDTAGNLRRITRTLKEIDTQEAPKKRSPERK